MLYINGKNRVCGSRNGYRNGSRFFENPQTHLDCQLKTENESQQAQITFSGDNLKLTFDSSGYLNLYVQDEQMIHTYKLVDVQKSRAYTKSSLISGICHLLNKDYLANYGINPTHVLELNGVQHRGKLSKNGSGWKNAYGTLYEIINEETQQL